MCTLLVDRIKREIYGGEYKQERKKGMRLRSRRVVESAPEDYDLTATHTHTHRNPFSFTEEGLK